MTSTHGAASGAPMATWIPVDVKIHWFSFLSAKDLANCGRVCRSWVSLTTKAADAMITMTTCATSPPQLSRAGKMKLLHRLQNATEKEHFGYLLAWAAGSRELLPFLHKLLLLRDVIREDLGLPGGLHETARPEAYDELDDSLKALFTYQSGKGDKAIEYVAQPPLIVAAQRGNVDAIHLLLLFGEGVHARRKGNDRALYVACEQGNVQCVAALLGRVPLRPPKHPAHSAHRLGLIRPVYSVYNAGYTYSSGISAGLLDVASSVAGAKIRAEFASATGISTGQGTRASLAASQASTSKGGQSFNTEAPISVTEIAVMQTEQFESDGRYRHWCRNYRMGTFWSTYDTALAAYEAIHGPIGEQADLAIPQFAQQQLARAAANASAAPSPYVAVGGGSRPSVGGRGGAGAVPVPAPKKKKADLNKLTSASLTVNLNNLKSRLDYRLAPGSHPFMIPRIHAHSLPPAFVSQALILDRLPGNSLLQMAAKMRPRGHIHPRIPPPIDYGVIAADSIAIKVRLNIGPIEGRTPLLVAAERGRVEIAFLLLSHHDPLGTLSGVIPDLVKKLEDDPSTPAGAAAAPIGAGAQPAAGGAPQAAAPANLPLAITGPGVAAGAAAGAAIVAGAGAPAPVVIPPSVLAARAALAAIADASPSSLAVSPESLSAGSVASSGSYGVVMLGSNYSFQPVDQDSQLTVAQKKVLASVSRRAEVLSELLKETRDRVDVDMHPAGSHTPLCLAAERGDARLIQQLLHWGADPNLPGRKEARPLLVAAMAGHEKVIKLLLRISCAPPEAKAVANAIETIRDLRKARKIAQIASAASASNKRGVKPGADTDDDDDDEEGGNDDAENDQEDEENSGTLARRGMQPKISPLKPLYSPRPPPLHATRRQLLSSVIDMEVASSTDAICSVLGIGKSAADALRALKGQARAGRRRRKDKSSTAASAAMGSTIAVQNGRRKAAGDDGEDDDGDAGGEGGGGSDGSAKKEEFSINTCEPCVIATLAAAAISSSAGQLDEWGVPLPPTRPPFNPSELFLPVDEATFGNFDRSGSGAAVLEYYKEMKNLFRGSRESSYSTAADKKQRAPARVGGLASLLAIGTDKMTAHMKQIQQAAEEAAAAAAETNAILSTADILSFPTAASYTEQVWHHDRFKALVKNCCNSVLARSRIASGTGALEGRPTIIVDVGDESGYSALFILACAGKLHSVMLLVHAGADVTQATKRGKTPIYGAVEKCHTEVVEFLMPRYSASQLRANTTYGTNVIHAANKAGNSRIRDSLQAYCVDYDMRQARMLKQEAAVRRKQMWGEGEGGNPGESGGHIAEGSEAAAHLAKLKRMAEVAKRKQEEKSWAQLRKLKGDAAVDEMIAAAEAGASPKAERGRAAEKGGELAVKRATSITLGGDFPPQGKPPKVTAGSAKGASTGASAKASGSRARSTSRDSAVSEDDGASAAETLSGDEARPVNVVKREKPTTDRGGIAIAKLAAAAAEARIEREKAAAAAAAPPKFGGIPASVYAAAAAASKNNAANPLSSPPPPPPKSSSTNSGPSSMSSPTSGLSPYARRMDGTISPASASISHLTRPSGSTSDDNGSKSSPSSGTSGTTSSSSPLSTHQVTFTNNSSSTSQNKNKSDKNNVAASSKSKQSTSTTRPSSSDSGNISDVESADTGSSSLTDSVFDRLAARAKDAELKKKLTQAPITSKNIPASGPSSAKPAAVSRSSTASESASDVRTLARQEVDDPSSSSSVSARAARAAYFDRLFVSSSNNNASESKGDSSIDDDRNGAAAEPTRSGSPMRSPPRNLAALNTSGRSSGGASDWAQSVVRSSGLSTEDVDKMLAEIDATQAKDKKELKSLKSAAGGGARAVQSARAALATSNEDAGETVGKGGSSPGALSEPGTLPPRSVLGQASGAQKNSASVMPSKQQTVSKAALLGAALGTAGMVQTMSGSNFVPARQALSLASKSTGHFDGAFSTQDTKQPNAPQLGQFGLEKGEMAAREERNRLREEQKLLKIQKAREDLEARSRELERQAAMHSKEMGLTSAATLAKAMAAYGGAFKK